MSFKDKVNAVTRTIPKGETLSYKEVAKRAGSPKAYRAVGNILAKNTDPNIPCYRVIKSNGRLGSGGKREWRRKTLQKEGVDL